MSIPKRTALCQNIFVLRDSKLFHADVSELSHDEIGHKASGLLSLPPAWYPPFFLADSKSLKSITVKQIIEIFHKIDVEITFDNSIIVRSNYNDESILQRGARDSYKVKLKEAKRTLLNSELEDALALGHESLWLIQKLEVNKISGHLSNERRFSFASRDWVYETESSDRRH